MSMAKYIIGLLILVMIFFTIYFSVKYVQINNYKPNGKYKILMAGRSTTDMWFRYWNLPSFLNKISVWRNWYIPYQKYVYENIYFEYLAVPSPHKNIDISEYYGQEMYNVIVKKIELDNYDALSFKFCFVDFDDRSILNREEAEQRYNDMISLMIRVHQLTQNKNIKLILQNSLPSFKSSKFGQEIRKKLNNWLSQYVMNQPDVVEVKLFENLIDESNNLKPEYSIDPSDQDSHINQAAFKIIEKEFINKVNQIIGDNN